MRILVVLPILALAACGRPALPVEPHAAEIALAKHNLELKVTDPASAQYRAVRYHAIERPPHGTSPTWRVCGEVNVKNVFGGYAGFRPFVASADVKSSDLLPDAVLREPNFPAAWAQLCGLPAPEGLLPSAT